jgi:hypothetical protein
MIKWPFLKLLPSITVHKVMDNDRYIQKYGLTKFSKREQLIFKNFFEYKFGNFSSMNIRSFLIIHYFCQWRSAEGPKGSLSPQIS